MAVMTLRVVGPDGKSKDHEFEKNSIIIGSDAECQLRLDGLEHEHARIRVRDGVATLQDLHSEDGIDVDGAPVRTGEIGNGAVIDLGEYKVTFYVGAPPAAEEPKAEKKKKGEPPVRVARAADNGGGNGKAPARAAAKKPAGAYEHKPFYTAHLKFAGEDGKTFERDVKVKERPWEYGYLAVHHHTEEDPGNHKIHRLLEMPELLIGNPPPAPDVGEPNVPDVTPGNQVLEVALLWGGKPVTIRSYDMSKKKEVRVGSGENNDFFVPADVFAAESHALFNSEGRGASIALPSGVEATVTRHGSDDKKTITGTYSITPGEAVLAQFGEVGVRATCVANESPPGASVGGRLDYNLLGMLLGSLLFHVIGTMLVVMFVAPMNNASEEDVTKSLNKFTKLVVVEEKPPEPVKVDGPKANDQVNNKIKTNEKKKPDKNKALNSGLLGVLNNSDSVSSVFGAGGLGVEAMNALSGLSGVNYGGADALGGLGTRGAGAGGAGGAVGIGGMGMGAGRGGGYGSINLGAGGKGEARVSPGQVITQGGLDKDVIARIIRRYWPQIKYCYEKELNKNPNLYGKIVPNFTIGPDGRVQSANIIQSEMNSDPVESCIVRNILRWRFPQPKGGGVVIVTYPFIFKAN